MKRIQVVAAVLAVLAVGAVRADYSSIQWKVENSNIEFAYAGVEAVKDGYSYYLMDQTLKGGNLVAADGTGLATELLDGANAIQSYFAAAGASGTINLASDDYRFSIALFDSDFGLQARSNESMSFSQLSALSYVTTPPNANGDKVWTVSSFTAVPEPTSGMLFLLGLASLALRRKRV